MWNCCSPSFLTPARGLSFNGFHEGQLDEEIDLALIAAWWMQFF